MANPHSGALQKPTRRNLIRTKCIPITQQIAAVSEALAWESGAETNIFLLFHSLDDPTPKNASVGERAPWTVITFLMVPQCQWTVMRAGWGRKRPGSGWCWTSHFRLFSLCSISIPIPHLPVTHWNTSRGQGQHGPLGGSLKHHSWPPCTALHQRAALDGQEKAQTIAIQSL